MMFTALLTAVLLSNEPLTIDLEASAELRLFRREWLPAGLVVDPGTLSVIHGYAHTRVEGGDDPWGHDTLSAELSAWALLGALAEPLDSASDGDLQAAWVQRRAGRTRVRLGRQVTTSGAARYARFDGVAAGYAMADLAVEGYTGFTVLPRWNKPRGYFLLGDRADLLRDPSLVESEQRHRHWLAGARLAWSGVAGLRASLGLHEQRTLGALAFRNLAADAQYAFSPLVSGGGRVVLDLGARAAADARAYCDVLLGRELSGALDYSYQAPQLMLPATSIFSAFGAEAWHELGTELSWVGAPRLRLTARGAAQLYEDDTPGARASLRAVWSPDARERWRLHGEVQRTLAAARGYVHARAALVFRPATVWLVTADAGVYVYDQEVRSSRASLVTLASVERDLGHGLRTSVAASIASTPYAEHEAQAQARLAVELDALSGGGGPW